MMPLKKNGSKDNMNESKKEKLVKQKYWPSKILGVSSDHHLVDSTKNILGSKKELLSKKGSELTRLAGWCPGNEKDSLEWIELHFPSHVGGIHSVYIVESYHGGAIVKISGRKENDNEWTVLWSRLFPTSETSPRIFKPMLSVPSDNLKVNELRLDLDLHNRTVLGTQVDAVCLVCTEYEKYNPVHVEPKWISNNAFSDFTFIINQKSIPAHKIVIANQCYKIYPLFSKSDSFEIVGVTEEVFSKVLLFLYTGKMTVEEDKLEEYILAADQLGLMPVKKECVHMLLKDIDKDSVIKCLVRIGEKAFKYDTTEMLETCLKFVEENCFDVLESGNMGKIPSEIFCEILKSSKLVIDELELFLGVIKWSKAQKDQAEAIKKPMSYIRFCLMTTDDLDNVVKPTGYCSEKDMEEALTYQKSPEKFEGRTETKYQSRHQLLVGSKILSAAQSQQLMRWVAQKGKRFTLAWQGTRDGFDTKIFHSLCDKYKESIVVIKSESNDIFGGYSADTWGGSSYSSNPKSFLFSLVNSANMPQMLKSKGQGNETYRYASYGPTFGSGHDIYICNASNTTGSSYSNFPYSFVAPTNFTGTANTFFAGSYTFKTKEIEVYGLV